MSTATVDDTLWRPHPTFSVFPPNEIGFAVCRTPFERSVSAVVAWWNSSLAGYLRALALHSSAWGMRLKHLTWVSAFQSQEKAAKGFLASGD